MAFPRAAGVLLHPTSLPSPGGIGDLGPDAHRFVEWMAGVGLRLWQVLPLGPTGYGDSPYQCFSAFAGNPLLIHVPGFGVSAPTITDAAHVDFATVIPAKRAALDAWLDALPYDTTIRAFVEQESQWLPDYALFMAIKGAQGGAAWTEWPRELADRQPDALTTARRTLQTEMQRCYKEQFVFHSQLRALREQCATYGIQLMGDVPIYVAHDSADVWAHRELFQLHPDGSLIVQAGVPPDYFSATGQLWGNPLYTWQYMEDNDFRWWTARMRAAFRQFDVVRLDHFRGFAAYWEVPGDADTAVNGRWVDGPGQSLFDALTRALGPLPIIAEDLGLITPDVAALRDACGFPGMAILQFAFAGESSEFLPHRFVRNLVVYTGTHDNDTTMGWWQSTGGDSTRALDEVMEEKARALRYLGVDTTADAAPEMHWTLMRAAMASVANTVLVPMQDVLGLGNDARMNMPGRTSGNWSFRFTWEQLTADITTRLRDLVRTYER
ncbi:MAG: 4-alpha-glucanotransferase [Gemmatimonadaceae bacterium]|nr:4-alpha-glucanotransferase [Gemmatimonadaceae bacterium]